MLIKKLTKCAAAALTIALAMGTTSCHTPKDVTYFQDVQDGDSRDITSIADVVVRPDDRVSIVVVSKDASLANLFNLPVSAECVAPRWQNTSRKSLSTATW